MLLLRVLSSIQMLSNVHCFQDKIKKEQYSKTLRCELFYRNGNQNKLLLLLRNIKVYHLHFEINTSKGRIENITNISYHLSNIPKTKLGLDKTFQYNHQPQNKIAESLDLTCVQNYPKEKIENQGTGERQDRNFCKPHNVKSTPN